MVSRLIFKSIFQGTVLTSNGMSLEQNNLFFMTVVDRGQDGNELNCYAKQASHPLSPHI